MIFLWNHERVLGEVFELAIMRISVLLGVPEAAITGSVTLDGDKIVPSFEVARSANPKLKVEQIQSGIGTVWGSLKRDLRERLGGMHTRRYGC